MFSYLFSAGSEVNVKQCVLFVPSRPTVYLLFISIIRNKTCTFRISYNSIMILNDTKVNYNVSPVDTKIHSMRHG